MGRSEPFHMVHSEWCERANERIAELEAELAALKQAVRDGEGRYVLDNYPGQFLKRFEEYKQRAEQAEAKRDDWQQAAHIEEERVLKLSAELAALKARTCETCAKWLDVTSPLNSDLRLCGDKWSGASPTYMSADCYCSFWAAREQP